MLLSMRVQPNAAQNEVVGLVDDVWHIRVAAPPVKSKANQELVSFLSQLLGLSKSNIKIVRGHTGKNKVIAIDGLSQEDAIRQLTPG